jgi:transposase-like protein
MEKPLSTVSKYSEQERRKFVAEWRTSGLSQAAFCRREGIEEWRLSNWKRSEAKRGHRDKSKAPETAGTKPGRKRRAIAESESFGRNHVFAQVKSGLRRGEYCQLHNLSINSFKRWRNKFVGELKTNALFDSVQTENPFVEVRLPSVPQPKAEEEDMVELILPGRIRVRVTERTPLRLLVQVLKIVQELKC